MPQSITYMNRPNPTLTTTTTAGNSQTLTDDKIDDVVCTAMMDTWRFGEYTAHKYVRKIYEHQATA